jgi:hypothetical protein
VEQKISLLRSLRAFAATHFHYRTTRDPTGQHPQMKIVSNLILVLLTAVAPCVQGDEPARDAEAFMERYLLLWNAGDAATIVEQIYRFDAAHPFGSREGLKAEFDRLKASGYSHSEKISIKGCWINATQALVDLRYSRLKRDGTAMPPAERSTLYFVKKTADGLRINNLIPMNPTTVLSCASFKQEATPAASTR